MGNDAPDKNKGGIQRTQKSVQRDQPGGEWGLYRDGSSGDENSEDGGKHIPKTQSTTGGGETRTSPKVFLHKDGIRKSQSGGAREEDFENRSGGIAVEVGKKRTREAHATAKRPEKRRNHNGRDVTSTIESNPDTNPVLGEMGEEGAVGGTWKNVACASTSGGGARAQTAVVAASASTSDGGARAKTVAATASASTSECGAGAKTVAAAASASTSG